MSINNYHPSTYHAQTTEKPVKNDEEFYQEKQSGGLCSVHSVNALFGKLVATPAMIAQAQTDFEVESMGFTLKSLENSNCSAEYTESDINDGVDPGVVCAAINKISPDADYKEEIKGKAIEVINHPLLAKFFGNKVILSIIGDGSHFLALRKDLESKWRVIDSDTKSHLLTTTQPKFDTIREAIAHAVKSHNSGSFGFSVGIILDRNKMKREV